MHGSDGPIVQIGKVEDARSLAILHKDKQPHLLELCLEHAEGTAN